MSSYVNNLTSADPIHALRYAVSYDKFLNNDEKIFKPGPLKWSSGRLGSKTFIFASLVTPEKIEICTIYFKSICFPLVNNILFQNI